MTTQLHVTALGLPGVLLLKSIVHADARGSFTQSWQAADWRVAGVDIAFILTVTQKKNDIIRVEMRIKPGKNVDQLTIIGELETLPWVLEVNE